MINIFIEFFVKICYNIKGDIMNKKYYDGTKILSLKDANGKTPEIYIITSNRTGGKTTYYNNLLVKRYLKGVYRKAMLIFRHKYECESCAESFFKGIKELYYPDSIMESEVRCKGAYVELFLDKKPFGYGVSLTSAKFIKNNSHLFSDTDAMIFDEFMPDDNHDYLPKEPDKLISIHTSVARGNNKHTRYVPVFMLSNPVSLINPYYLALGISSKLQSNTKFLKGDGFIVEQGYVDSASKALKESAFMRAFKNQRSVAYSAEGIYLNDNYTFVDRVDGKSSYICTLIYNDENYGVRQFSDQGIIYVTTGADNTYPVRIAVTTSDHNINSVMLKRNSITLTVLEDFFRYGLVRFKNLQCKEAFFAAMNFH